MPEPIRLATPEEVEVIAKEADLTVMSSVFAFKDARAIVRNCFELDPVFYGTLTDREKLLFTWGLENILRSNRVPEYYFQVDVEDETWRHVAETFGAKATSPVPEIRYKKALT